MGNLNIYDLVENHINEDKEKLSKIVNNINIKNKKLADLNIQDFFPEFKELSINYYSNNPRGIPLPHQLLLGPPTLFALEPMSEHEFEKRYRISIRVVEELVDMGRVIPNLYVRNPARWKGMEHYRYLIEKSFVNGERVNTYFNIREPQFNNFILQREKILKQKFKKLEKVDIEQTNSFIEIARSTRQDACRVIANRWAYLDIVAKEASEYVSQLVDDLKLEEAANFIRVSKHIFVSPISASLGSNFIWGPKDIALLAHPSEYTVQKIQKTYNYLQKEEQIEFLLNYITGTQPFRYLKDFQVEYLINLLKDNDLIDLKSKLFESMDIMTRFLQKGIIDNSKIEEWKRLVEEIQKIHSHYERFGRLAFETSSILGIAIGTLINPIFGIGTGIFFQAILKEFANKVGSTIYKMINPDKHRFIGLLTEIKTRTHKD